MPIDASIPLQIRPPTQGESPLQTVAGLMQIRNSAAEYQLRQAQAVDAQAQADQRKRDLQDQGVLQELMADPDSARKLGAGDWSPAYGRVQQKTIDAGRKAVDEHTTSFLANDTAKNTLYKEHAAELEKGLSGLLQLAQDSDDFEKDLPRAYSQYIGTSRANGILDILPPGSQPPETITDVKQLKPMIAATGMYQESVSRALGIQKSRQDIAKTQAETGKTEAETAKTAAETPGVEAASEMTGIQRDLMKAATSGDTASAESLIDQRIPIGEFPESAAYNAQAHAAYRAALASGSKTPLEDARKAVEDIAKNTDEIRKQKAEIPGKVAESAAVEKATSPLKVNQAVQTEIQKAKLAPGAVSGILNPTLQNKVIGDWTKAGEEYQGKVGDAQRLHDYIDAVRSGNQNAAALLPIAEVRALVNRVNSQELNAAGGGVSWARNLQNWLDKGVEGKPSDATLNEMSEVADKTLDAAKRVWTGKVTNLNTLGAKFPTEPPELPPSHSAPSVAAIPTPATQAEYNALKKGDKFKKPNDPTVYVKQ